MPIPHRVAWCVYGVEHYKYAIAREEACVSVLTCDQLYQLYTRDTEHPDQAHAKVRYASMAGTSAPNIRINKKTGGIIEPEWGWSYHLECTLISLSILARSAVGLTTDLPDPVLNPLPASQKKTCPQSCSRVEPQA